MFDLPRNLQNVPGIESYVREIFQKSLPTELVLTADHQRAAGSSFRRDTAALYTTISVLSRVRRTRGQVPAEPFRSKLGDVIQGSGLFKEMSRSRDDLQIAGAAHPGHGEPV